MQLGLCRLSPKLHLYTLAPSSVYDEVTDNEYAVYTEEQRK